MLVLDAPPGELPPDPLPPTYPIRLHDVRWGGRRYLLRDRQLMWFCQTINDGTETLSHSCGMFLLRTGDADLPVTGLPALPAPWDDFLLKAPLQGHTLTVSDSEGSASTSAGTAFMTTDEG